MVSLKAACRCGSCWTLPQQIPAPAEDVADTLLRARCGLCQRHPRVYLARPARNSAKATAPRQRRTVIVH